jgi:hypothetical protein
MHIQTIILIVLLVSKMAQLKHSKKVEPNDAFIGILILYILIQSLTSNTKEFAIPGAENTEIDETAWENLHIILRQLYSENTVTIPGNVHIKGDLLVGSYKGSIAEGNSDPNYDASWEASKTNVTDWRENNNADGAGFAMEPATGTGTIYSWQAKHQEVNTNFITRNRTAGTAYTPQFLICGAREAYRAAVDGNTSFLASHLKVGMIRCHTVDVVTPDGWIKTNYLIGGSTDKVNIVDPVEITGDLRVSGGVTAGQIFSARNLTVNGDCRFDKGIRINGIKTNTDAHSHRDQGNWLQMHQGDQLVCYGSPDAPGPPPAPPGPPPASPPANRGFGR